MDKVYLSHDLPDKIMSDRFAIFMSKFWKILFCILNVKISPSIAYHSQTDGQAKIVSRELEEIIRCFVNYDKDNWDEHLVEFVVEDNASVHSTTAHTPLFLNRGAHPSTIPADLMVPQSHPPVQELHTNVTKLSAMASENIVKNNVQMAKYASLKRIYHIFMVGDKVFLSTKSLKLKSRSSTRKFHP